MNTLEAGKRIAIHQILFATDFSPPSNAALPYALSLAHQYGATLYGVHVLAPDDYLFVSPEVWPRHMQDEQQPEHEAVARLEGQLKAVSHRALCVVGKVWEELCHIMVEHDIDLLVVGTHGRTGAKKLLMGSIAEKIFRQSPCPVLTVGPKAIHPRKNGAEFDHILLATDLGVESETAASYAISLAHEHQATLSLLHVVARPEQEEPEMGSADSESNSDRLIEQLRKLATQHIDVSCHSQYFVQSGPPAERILYFAETHGVDLVVMGLHPHGVMSSVTHLHTTAQHVVAHAGCPVFTVRG
ncbi:MAG: universal stress protein [Terriglobales bacterium]